MSSIAHRRLRQLAIDYREPVGVVPCGFPLREKDLQRDKAMLRIAIGNMATVLVAPDLMRLLPAAHCQALCARAAGPVVVKDTLTLYVPVPPARL